MPIAPPNIDYSVKGEWKSSAYVATVHVLKVTWLDDGRRPTHLRKPLMLGTIPGGFDPYIGANYRVEVIRSFKGPQHRYLTIFSEITEARTPMLVGAQYLVFLHRQTAKGDAYFRPGDLTMDFLCGNSDLLKNSARAIRVLDKLSPTRAP